MAKSVTQALRLAALLCGCSLLYCCSAAIETGTWSIVAVDRNAEQIGVAGALCTNNVQ